MATKMEPTNNVIIKQEQVGVILFKVIAWIILILSPVFGFILIIPALILLGVAYILGYLAPTVEVPIKQARIKPPFKLREQAWFPYVLGWGFLLMLIAVLLWG